MKPFSIAISGVHGSGKSHLVEELKNYYVGIGKSVYVVKEVARDCEFPLGTIQSQRKIWYMCQGHERTAFSSGCDILLFDRSSMDNTVYLRDILNQCPNPHGEDVFKFFYSVARAQMGKYDFVIRLPLNEAYIINDVADTLRPKDLEYAKRIDKLFDDMVDPFVNATVEDLPL